MTEGDGLKWVRILAEYGQGVPRTPNEHREGLSASPIYVVGAPRSQYSQTQRILSVAVVPAQRAGQR